MRSDRQTPGGSSSPPSHLQLPLGREEVLGGEEVLGREEVLGGKRGGPRGSGRHAGIRDVLETHPCFLKGGSARERAGLRPRAQPRPRPHTELVLRPLSSVLASLGMDCHRMLSAARHPPGSAFGILRADQGCPGLGEPTTDGKHPGQGHTGESVFRFPVLTLVREPCRYTL